NQPFPLASQQFPIRGANRVPTRPTLNRQRPMTPSTPQWPLNPGFPLVGQNQLLMQQPFPFSPDVMNNSPQLMLINQQRNNIAALYLQQMAQAQVAAAAQNASPIIRPIMNYPSNSNLSSASSNSPINKESPLTKQNSHSSLVNSPDSNTNTSSATTSVAPTTTTSSTPATATTAATTLAATTTSSTVTPAVAPTPIANPAAPITATLASTPLAAQNLLAAVAVANAVKPPTNPVEAALAASNTVTAGNIASPVFQQKLLPITQVIL
ncbi:hypothetical protein PIROE2DRAFT_13656, partial [Piromyces sp. E2]